MAEVQAMVDLISKWSDNTKCVLWSRNTQHSGTLFLDTLVQFVMQKPSITKLDLRANQIGDDGAAILAQIPCIKRLDLGFNSVSAKGVRALASSPSITKLNYQHNNREKGKIPPGDEGKSS